MGSTEIWRSYAEDVFKGGKNKICMLNKFINSLEELQNRIESELKGEKKTFESGLLLLKER